MDWSAIGLAAAEDAGVNVKEDVTRNEENLKSGTKY